MFFSIRSSQKSQIWYAFLFKYTKFTKTWKNLVEFEHFQTLYIDAYMKGVKSLWSVLFLLIKGKPHNYSHISYVIKHFWDLLKGGVFNEKDNQENHCC